VLFRIHEQTGNWAALEQALVKYRAARAAWFELANRAKTVYVADITVGERPFLRGHWMDRLPAIDADIAAVEKRLASAKDGAGPGVMQEALGRPRRAKTVVRHDPPKRYQAGQRLDIEISLAKKALAVRLYYRHVNHAERFQSVEMEYRDDRYRATVPATYTESPYPLQYYFEIDQGAEGPALYPGFGTDLTGQPYYVVRRG
jgi:hypothetical protein